MQRLEFARFGKKERTVTLSLFTGDDLYSVTGTVSFQDQNGSCSFATPFGEIRMYTYNSLTEFTIDVAPGKETKIQAAKLELGSFQTLAHKEGSKWVLNEIPDYALELLKCQRYQFTSGGRESIYNLAIGTATSNKIVDFFLPLPTIMRTKAAVSFSNLYVSNSTIHHKVSRIENYGNVANGVWLHVTTEDSNLTTGQAYYLRTANPFSFILDANL